MTPVAILFLVLSLTLVWGGLIVSAIALSIRPETRHYPVDPTDPQDGQDGQDDLEAAAG